MFAEAVPVPDIQNGTSLIIRAAGNDTVSCGFEGNSDFYGLGIRLGIYLQWITTLLAHLFFDESIPGNLELNCVFLVAVSAATLVATRAGTIRPAECLVLLHLCFGFIFSILSIWGHRIDMKFSLAGSSFRLALATAISAYAVWFWSRGRELFVQDACQTFTFIVVPKAVSDPIGTFYKTQSSVVLAVYGFLLARELLTAFCFFVFCAMASGVFAGFYVTVIQSVRASSDPHGYHLNRVLRMWAVMTMTVFWAYFNGQKSAGVYRPSLFAYIIPVVDVTIFVWWSAWQLLYLLVMGKSPPPGFTYPPLISTRLLRKRSEQPAGPGKMQAVFQRIRKLMMSTKILFVVNISCLAWAVIAIEITLHWNSVSGIYDIATTGQLIPFIIGIVSILRFFLALTVQSTTQYVTNILLQLFDRKPRVDSVEDGTVGEARVVNRDFVYPISPRHEAVFWNRIRPRRQSMGTDPKLSEDRPDKVRYQQMFHYDRYLAEYYSNSGSELSSDDDDISDVDQASNVYCEPASSWIRGLRHGFGGPASSWMRELRYEYRGPTFSGTRALRQSFVTSWEGHWEFDNAELDQRTAITLVGYKAGSNFPDTMKRICVKPAWEDDLDFQVRARIASVGSGALLKLNSGSVDNGSLGPDNLADLPPGRIHSYYFSSGIHSQSPSVPPLPESSDLGSEGGRKTYSTTTSSRRFASLRVLVNLFFTALSWIFSEQRILWAFEQYGIILGLSIFGRLWHHLKIALGIQPDKETQSRARSLESTHAEYSPSEDLPQESPQEHGHWGPHRKPLGSTAWEQYHNQDLYSLHDHIESLCGILNLHLQARGLTHCSAALQSIKRLVDDLSQTRQEFVDGAIGLEQQHVRARTQRYNFLHRLDAVEWAKMAETEIKTLLLQYSEDHKYLGTDNQWLQEQEVQVTSQSTNNNLAHPNRS